MGKRTKVKEINGNNNEIEMTISKINIKLFKIKKIR
jgi:hypothetical protein